MNYEEIAKQSQKKLEELKVRKARVQEQISMLTKQLGLDETKSIEKQLDELEKANAEKKEALDKQLTELETKFKELEDEFTESQG